MCEWFEFYIRTNYHDISDMFFFSHITLFYYIEDINNSEQYNYFITENNLKSRQTIDDLIDGTNLSILGTNIYIYIILYCML